MKPPAEGALHVAVIGAGAAGLIAMKELLERGIRVTAFERGLGPGGLFRDCYEGALLTSSSVWTAFACYPPRLAAQEGFADGGTADRPLHWTAAAYTRYLEAFARHFGLNDHIRYGSRVERCRWEGARWTVESSGATAGIHHFDRLLVCSGTNQGARPPSLPGMADFEGEILHSSQLHEVESRFAGRRVLLLGGGESASDLALRAQRVATACAISVRARCGHITPRTLGAADLTLDLEARGEPPADSDISLAKIGMPGSLWLLSSWGDALAAGLATFRPSLRGMGPGMAVNLTQGSYITRQFGTKTTGFSQAIAEGARPFPAVSRLDARGACFVDGRRFDCDLIILATGFDPAFPFLEEEGIPGARGGFDSRALFKHIFHPEWGTRLAFIGFARPAFGTIPGICELQARYVGALLTEELTLPPPAALAETIRTDAAFERARLWSADSIPALTDFAWYLESMGELLGCRPRHRALWRRDPRLWMRGLVCQHSAVRYSLEDPGPAGALARDTLRAQIAVPSAGYDLHLFLLATFFSALGWETIRPITVRRPSRLQRLALWATLPLWLVLLVPSLYLVGLIALYRCLTPYHWDYCLARLRGQPLGQVDFAAVADPRTTKGRIYRAIMVPLTLLFMNLSLPVYLPTLMILRGMGIRVREHFVALGLRERIS